MRQLKKITSSNGRMLFTTLVKNNRLADKYLQALADRGKLISRTVADHKDIFEQSGITATYETTGNILVIKGNNREDQRTNEFRLTLGT